MTLNKLVLSSAGAAVVAGIVIFSRASSPVSKPEAAYETGREPELIQVQGSRPGNPNAAPDLTLEDLSGRTVTLSSYLGKKVVILEFWATWCKPCRYMIPMVQEYWRANRSRGVELFLVNQQESRERVDYYASAAKLEARVLLDFNGAAGSAYGVYGLPTLFVIDKEGTLRFKQVGYNPEIQNTLKKVIDPLLK